MLKKKLVGIIGFPLKHSISPAFQQAAFDFCGLPVEYQAWETPAESFEERVRLLREPDCLGTNVTIPYKEAVIPLLDEVEGKARLIGAVNTVVNRKGRLIGYNTDAEGFIRALEDDAGFESFEKKAVILGAGGAARAVAVALLTAEVGELAIFNRTTARAEALANDLIRRLAVNGIQSLPWNDTLLNEKLSQCDLLVNTTAIGMAHSPRANESPLAEGLIPVHALVYDLVYNPPETMLLRLARLKGARTLNGLAMLVYQGAAAFTLWTGEKAPLGLMLDKARRALR